MELDPLTTLPLRAAFVAAAEQSVLDACRSDAPLALLYVDVNHMKAYNDRHGHDKGDEFLVRTARMLDGLVTPQHALCRFGGDEFAVLAAVPFADAVLLAERIRGAAERQLSPVTLSVGVAARPQGTGWSFTQLLHLADIRLHHAHASGRNIVAAQTMPESWLYPELKAAGPWPGLS